MNAVIIGSGNVATTMIRLMLLKGINVSQVFSRNETSAKELNKIYAVPCTSKVDEIVKNADFYLLCISDDALNENLSYLQGLNDKPVYHTAAAVSKEVLKTISADYGVIYPLQSLRKEMKDLPKIPFLLDANNDKTLQMAISIVEKIGDGFAIANDEERLKIHVAAVMVNNFTNHLFALAEEYCKTEKLEFDLLKPLIAETAQRVLKGSPAKMQTGPAVRRDHITMEKHLKILNEHPDLQQLYITLSDSIINHQR
jgi:predicted short-subunit dehydrogenase-like oxidoreductase (DUF2520 family)